MKQDGSAKLYDANATRLVILYSHSVCLLCVSGVSELNNHAVIPETPAACSL